MEKHSHYTLDVAMDTLELPAYAREVIKRLYSEPHRSYHNISHLEKMLRWVPPKHIQIEALLEAILWHDIIYPAKIIPHGMAEALSAAEYMRFSLLAGKSDFDVEPLGRMPRSDLHDYAVLEMINASARHLEDQQFISETTKLFLDLDLQSFAQPWEEMQEDSVNVMKEFTPIVGEAAFLKGNANFLTQLLKRKRLYYTAPEAWEVQARKNLKKRLAHVKKLIPQD